MNTHKVQNEINAIIETVAQAAHKQHPAAKHQLETLKSLGILDFVPARKRGNVVGYADAAAVIEAVQDSGKVTGGMVNGEGDVYKHGASALYLAMNEETAAPMHSDSDDYEDMEDYEETERENERIDALMNEVSDMEQAKWIQEQAAKEELESVLTASEVDEIYNLATGTARQACNRGQIVARKSGATWLIRKADASEMWRKD
jgi:hypothetical protein